MTWDGIFYFAERSVRHEKTAFAERSVRHENTAFAGAAMAPDSKTLTPKKPVNRKGDITMKTNLKKFAALILAVLFVCCFAACGGEQQKVSVIGISQYGEHESLDNCRLGFLQGLKDAGLTEGVDYVIDYQNAGFDDNIVKQIAESFSANNVALMCGIATPSAMACYAAAENKNIPVIFTAITDPVQAKLDTGNVTGTSDKLAVEGQLELIRAMQPDAETIGILYTTSEPNSVSAIAEYEEKAPAYGFTIEAVGVTSQPEVVQACDTLLAKGVDCMSNLTDNNVVGMLPAILEKTNAKKVPVYGSEIEQVKKGCVASIGIDYFELGRQTGAMAAKVLKGEATCEEMPYETIKEYGLYVSYPAMEEMGLTLPEDYAARAIDANA